MSETRQSSDGPWCWQSKAALKAIREGFDAERGVTSALAVYLTMTELASNEQKERFQTTHAHIAALSGLSVRTVQDRLKGLAELKIISVDTPALRMPSTYTLLPFGNGCRTSGNGCGAFGNPGKQGSLPTLEESKESEESEKNLPEESGDAFDELAKLAGRSPTNKLTPSAAGATAKALKDIREVFPRVTGMEIRNRVAAYRRLYPRATVTPTAIAKHWAMLVPAATKPIAEGFIS